MYPEPPVTRIFTSHLQSLVAGKGASRAGYIGAIGSARIAIARKFG
jgi:hypothetical protein